MFLLRRKAMPDVGLGMFAGLVSAGYAAQAGEYEGDGSLTIGYVNGDEDGAFSKIRNVVEARLPKN